jgi:hypothetical protein
MFQYLQNPIIFSIVVGICVAIYIFFEDSLEDKPVINKTKYIRAFILTMVGINVLQTYSKKSMNPSMNQSYNVGNAPF